MIGPCLVILLDIASLMICGPMLGRFVFFRITVISMGVFAKIDIIYELTIGEEFYSNIFHFLLTLLFCNVPPLNPSFILVLQRRHVRKHVIYFLK